MENPVNGGEAPVPASPGRQGAASPESPLSLRLPLGEPLVGNWSRAKHLLDGWGLSQKWGRVETPEAVEVVLSEIEDC